MLSLGRFSAVALLLTVLSMSNFYAASAGDTPRAGVDNVIAEKEEAFKAAAKKEEEAVAAKKEAEKKKGLLGKETADGDGKQDAPGATADVPGPKEPELAEQQQIAESKLKWVGLVVLFVVLVVLVMVFFATSKPAKPDGHESFNP